jgi:UDP-2-acetamido-3-amino-2,3-dideoxy-glucuronate N-acetyltransferase
MMNSDPTKIFIHDLAQVFSKEIGEGTKIWQFSIVLEGAEIGRECNINCHTLIEGKAKIGDRVTIKPGVYLWDGICLEDDVMVGPNATFTNDKWPKSKNKDFVLQETILKRGASIGANATILSGISIGAYALIAAGSTVTKSVPDRALMIGSPARISGWMNEDGTRMVEDNGLLIDNKGQFWKVVNNELIKV